MLEAKYNHIDKYTVLAECSSPLHIGSAMGGKEEVLLHPVDNKPFIQASSIAGVMRTAAIRQDKELAEKMFGASRFEENTNSHDFASMVKVSDGVFDMKTVKMELRPRVAIDSFTGTVSSKDKQGSKVASGQKFDTEFIGAGAEFSFSVYLYRDDSMEYRIALEKIFAELKAEQLQFGGQKTNGSGYIKMKKLLYKEFDMKDAVSREEWQQEDVLPESAYISILDRLGSNQEVMDGYAIIVNGRTDGSILVKGIAADVFGSNAPDSENMRNTMGDYIIPGSSLKGSLRNRMSYIARIVDREFLIKEIFGRTENGEKGRTQSAVSGKKKKTGSAGHIFARDTVVGNQNDNKSADMQHRIHIDKFTGGVIHGGLFTEKNAHGEMRLHVTVSAFSEGKETKERNQLKTDAAAGLLILALRDLALGLMNLGSGYNTGKGFIDVSDIKIRKYTDGKISDAKIDVKNSSIDDTDGVIDRCMYALKRVGE